VLAEIPGSLVLSTSLLASALANTCPLVRRLAAEDPRLEPTTTVETASGVDGGVVARGEGDAAVCRMGVRMVERVHRVVVIDVELEEVA
jgi:hypothetical protein